MIRLRKRAINEQPPRDNILEKKAFSFWRILHEQWGWRLFGYEGLFGVAVGLAGGIPLVHLTKVTDRVAVAGDFLTLVSIILGLLIAAFALIVAFFNESYTMLLQKNNARGVRAFFAVFMINIGIDIGFVLMVIAYRSSAQYLPHLAEKVIFVALIASFVYGALNVVAVTRTVMAHGVTRAKLIELEALERELSESGE